MAYSENCTYRKKYMILHQFFKKHADASMKKDWKPLICRFVSMFKEAAVQWWELTWFPQVLLRFKSPHRLNIYIYESTIVGGSQSEGLNLLVLRSILWFLKYDISFYLRSIWYFLWWTFPYGSVSSTTNKQKTKKFHWRKKRIQFTLTCR